MNLSNPVNLLIASIYFILAAAMSLFSVFGVYVLIRYGESKLLAFFVSILYSLMFLTVLTNSYHTLLGITS